MAVAAGRRTELAHTGKGEEQGDGDGAEMSVGTKMIRGILVEIG